MTSVVITKDQIAQELIRRFFSAIAAERFFVAFSTLGAFAVGAVSAMFGASELPDVVSWCGLVGATEFLLTFIDARFKHQVPPAKDLEGWAWAKTCLTAAHSLTWGSGVILLHHSHDAISTLAPAWAVLIFTSGLIYSCSSFPPCVVISLVAALLPPTLFLAGHSAKLDIAIAICMTVSLPFSAVIGIFSGRNIRASVRTELEVSVLLREARQAHQERARFYSTASHDLRQPVHALGLYASLLPTVVDDEERRTLSARISECTVSLDRHFNAILGVAEAERVVSRAQPRLMGLQSIMDTVVTTIAPQAAEKGLRLRCVASSIGVVADVEVLERVLLNLATNAVRYTHRGGVLLGVRRHGENVLLCVLDTGIGIPEDERERIFEDFHQVGNRQRSRDRGFGLGLSIVRRLCLSMGWHIAVASEVGRGSMFSVTLPAASPTSGESGADASAPPIEILSSALVVLLVDDDALICDATSRLLVNWGVRSEICRNGTEALAALAKHRTGEHWHALVDYNLDEGENGLELALRLRESGPPVLVSLMSGDVDEPTTRRAAEVGIEVVRKPIKPAQLRALLSFSGESAPSAPWPQADAPTCDRPAENDR